LRAGAFDDSIEEDPRWKHLTHCSRCYAQYLQEFNNRRRRKPRVTSSSPKKLIDDPSRKALYQSPSTQGDFTEVPSPTRDKTVAAVQSQLRAMGADVFEVGLFNPDAKGHEPLMILRVWDHESLLRSIGWLRHENRGGRNIYVRPKGEHNLSLVDDLSAGAIRDMARSGFMPAAVLETSPGNFLAWLRHPEHLPKALGTAAARALAEKFGGDRGAADWRHFGRLAGFTNRKEKYRDPLTGLHPFVILIQAVGAVYPAAHEFLARVRTELEQRHGAEEARRASFASSVPGAVGQHRSLKSIEEFRNDPRYGADGTRIDLAYAIYAISHGAGIREVAAEIRTRDLSHKGTEKRQADYVERTIKKAMEAAERGRGR
jgi:hypothetical protein